MQDRLGVIFDVDGVLVDSSQAHYVSWVDLAKSRGCPVMTEQQFNETFGRTSREVIADFYADQQLGPAQIADWDNHKEALYREALRRDFPEMPGARDLVDALLSHGFQIAAGSSGPPDNVELTLQLMNRRDRFHAVVTASDVERGKPDPQVFLLCAQRLGLKPSECIVIEDAAPGIAAANAAAMVSVGFLSTGHEPEELAEADHLVYSLSELTPQKLRNWVKAGKGRAV